MDYNYLQERQENRPSQEGHPQSQYPIHTQNQQYPAPHPVIQAGYPSLRFAPYLHTLQGSGAAPGQVPTQEGLLHTRISPTDPTPTTSSRGPTHRSHDFDNVLTTTAIHVGGPQLEYGPGSEVSTNPLAVPVQLTPSTTPSHQPHALLQNPGPAYRVDNHPSTSQTSLASSQSRINASSTGNTNPMVAGNLAKKRKDPSSTALQAAKNTNNSDPAVRVIEPPVQIQIVYGDGSLRCSMSSQTEPLFQEGMELERKANDAPGSMTGLPDGLRYGEKTDLTTMKKKRVVMATRDYDSGEQFGPFTGKFVKGGFGCCDPATWEICVKGRAWFYIDGSSDPSNWMSNVRVASCREDQNMEAFQSYGQIFFQTTRAVRSGTELRVFYSREYSKHVGFKIGLEDLRVDRETRRLRCPDCDRRYTNAKSLVRHCKFEHNKENNPVISPGGAGVTRDDIGEENTRKSEHQSREKPSIVIQTVGQQVERNVSKGHNPGEKKEKQVARSIHVGQISNDNLPGKLRKFTGQSNQQQEKVAQFTCNQCGKQFSSAGRLREHAAFHVDAQKDKLICEICGLECRNRKVLKQHEISHDPNALQCSLCQKYFRRKGDLVFHLRHDHMLFVGEKWGRGTLQEFIEANSKAVAQKDEEQKPEEVKGLKPICGVCGKEYKTYNALKYHALTHDTTTCQLCKKTYPQRQQFVSHMRKVHNISERHKLKKKTTKTAAKGASSLQVEQEYEMVEEEPFHPELPRDMLGRQLLLTSKKPKIYRCKFCPQRFRQRSRALKHEKVKHTNTGKYQCEYCTITFTEQYRYILHKRKHTKDRPFKCDECPTSFGSESALMNHKPEHRGERPYACEFCGKRFGTRKYMNAHRRRVHRAPRVLHKCTFCEKKFKSKSDLSRHEQRHKGIRPFVCLLCAKAFGTKSKLQNHQRIHTGERPFECHICQQKFALNHHLTAHMIFRHETKKGNTDAPAQE